MAVTKEHRIFIAVVGFAVGAMVIDRLLFNSSVSGTPRPAVANVPKVTPAATVSQPLSDLSGKPTVSSTKLWQAFKQTQTRPLVEPSISEKVQQGFDVEVFRQQHPLDAVMIKQGTSYAIINGQMLRVGEAVDGLKVVAIEKTSVMLASGDNRVKLELGPSVK